MTKNTLLTWSFIWADVAILFAMYKLNLLPYLFLDKFGITLSIITIYLLSNIVLFTMTMQVNKTVWKYLVSWVVQILPTLGLLGTVLGFFVMFHNIFPSGFDIGDAAATANAMAQLTNGFSIALITTISGIITSVILSLKMLILNVE